MGELEQFREYVERYQDCFGLGDWDITVEWKELEPETQAETAIFAAGRYARVALNTKRYQGIDLCDLPDGKVLFPMALEDVALHEVLHVLLADVVGPGTVGTECWEEFLVERLERIIGELRDQEVETPVVTLSSPEGYICLCGTWVRFGQTHVCAYLLTSQPWPTQPVWSSSSGSCPCSSCGTQVPAMSLHICPVEETCHSPK